MLAMSENLTFTFSSPQKQYFSFPPDIVSHLLKNPLSANGLMKLYQTCKYFYGKQPILIVTKPAIFDSSQQSPANMFQIFQHPKTLWLTESLTIQKSLFFQLPKIFRCTICELVIDNAYIKYANFQMLTSQNTIKSLKFTFSNCFNDDNTVPLDVILQNLPNVTSFVYCNLNETFSAERLTKMNKVKLLNKLRFCRLTLFQISSTFDPTFLIDFIKMNGNGESVFEFVMLQHADALAAAAKEAMQTWKGKKPIIKIEG